VEPERPQVGRDGNAAGAQIALGERTGERIGRRQQPANTLRQTGRWLRPRWPDRLGMRHSKESARLSKDVGETIIPAAQCNEIEKIAMFP
jgi:hypothetical protein